MGLDVNDTRQFLHSVEEQISLFDHGLVLPVLAVWSVSLDYTADSVGFTM